MTTKLKYGTLNLEVIPMANNAATDIIIKVQICSDIIPPRQFKETKKAEIFAIVATQIQAR